MNIIRAHSYSDTQVVANELGRMPVQWLEDIRQFGWYILPETLSPLWIGLMHAEIVDEPTGRLYSEIGGWCCRDPHPLFAPPPHIYLTPQSAKSAVHEAGHALEVAWRVDVRKFYKPDTAPYVYMAVNPEEYFACAVDAFLTPEQDDTHCNSADLANADPNLWTYLCYKLSEVQS